jgi:hypothetical protein
VTFVPSPAGPPGFFLHVRLPRPKPRKDGLHGLVLSFRALARALEPPLVGSSSRGIRVSPSHRHTSHASTPRSRSPFRSDAAKRRLTFRPRGFAPPRRFTPRESHGSVAPRNRSKVRRVSCVPPARATRRRLDRTGTFPATRFTPFEDFPSSAAVPHHCGRCLPAVTVLPGAKSQPKPSPLPTASPPRWVAYSPKVPTRESPVALPREAGWPVAREMGGPSLRRGPGFQSRVRAGAAPRSAVCLVEAEGPCPSRGGGAGPPRRSGSLSRWVRGARAPKSSRSRSRRGLARGAPKSSGCPVPVRRSSRCPEERRVPAPWAGCPSRSEVQVQLGWGADPPKRSGSLSRWIGARGAPKSAVCLLPTGRGSRCSEERRLPCPGWGGGPEAPKSSGFPVPMEPCARCSEERRLPDSYEAVRAVLRRAPFAVPRGPGFLAYEAVGSGRVRWGAAPPKRSGSLSRGVGCLMLRRASGSLSRGMGCRASEEVRFPVPWNGVPGAPKSAGFPVPMRSCARCSEEPRLPYPGGTWRAVLRRAPLALSRWPGVLPRRAGDGCAKKRFQCDDAPIRRSGPPRHRAHSAVGGRSSRRCHVKLPRRCGAEAPPPSWTIKPSPGAGSAPDDRDEAQPAARRRPLGFRGRNHGASVLLRPHPPKWADVQARRNLAKQPT